MFRRRPFRPFRRPMMRPVNPLVVQAVSRANQLLASGKPGDAAEIFERLAQEGESRGRPRPAANMHAHAANAYAIAKNEAAALTHARAALNQFIQLNMAERAPTFFANITRNLRENGMAGAAETLQKEFGDRVKTMSAQAAPEQARRGRLPPKCPHCAGPARSDEVEWIDEHSAECGYCGGVIQTEES